MRALTRACTGARAGSFILVLSSQPTPGDAQPLSRFAGLTPILGPELNLVGMAIVSGDRDRNWAHSTVGGELPDPLFRYVEWVPNSSMAYDSQSPPIIPDGRISRVRFEVAALPNWAFAPYGASLPRVLLA